MIRLPPDPPFSKHPQLPRLLLAGFVFQTLPQFHCPSLDTLQPLHVLLTVRDPELNTRFKVWPHQCWIQGTIPALALLATPLLIQARMPLAFLGTLNFTSNGKMELDLHHQYSQLCSVIWKPHVRLALGRDVTGKANHQRILGLAGAGNYVLGILPGRDGKVRCDISHGLHMPCHHVSFAHVVRSNTPHFSALYLPKLFTAQTLIIHLLRAIVKKLLLKLL